MGCFDTRIREPVHRWSNVVDGQPRVAESSLRMPLCQIHSHSESEPLAFAVKPVSKWWQFSLAVK